MKHQLKERMEAYRLAEMDQCVTALFGVRTSTKLQMDNIRTNWRKTTKL